jgi:hypothetical protein
MFKLCISKFYEKSTFTFVDSNGALDYVLTITHGRYAALFQAIEIFWGM